MLHLPAVRLQTHHVTADFSDGQRSFVLPKGATFAELAERIDGLEAVHHAAPIAISVHFSISGRARPGLPGPIRSRNNN